MRCLRSSKYLKTTVELKANTCSDCLLCSQLEIPFLNKFGSKTQKYQFKLIFCP